MGWELFGVDEEGWRWPSEPIRSRSSGWEPAAAAVFVFVENGWWWFKERDARSGVMKVSCNADIIALRIYLLFLWFSKSKFQCDLIQATHFDFEAGGRRLSVNDLNLVVQENGQRSKAEEVYSYTSCSCGEGIS